MDSFYARLSCVQRWLQERPRALSTAITVGAVAGLAIAIAFVWFAYDITSGLPDRDAIRGLGDMALSTTLYDVHDRPVFTIF